MKYERINYIYNSVGYSSIPSNFGCMNRKTLQKCIDELSKDSPKLDYVRGILETLIESLPEEKVFTPQKSSLSPMPKQIDESAMIESLGKLNKVDMNSIQTK